MIEDIPETLTIDIPVELRHKKPCFPFSSFVEPGEMDKRKKLQAARELVRKYIPENCSLSEELIADRRMEAGRE